MRRIVALMSEGPIGWLSDPRSILRRQDFECRVLSDSDQAFQTLLKGPVDLFLMHDEPAGAAEGFLHRLTLAYPGHGTPVLVLHNGQLPGPSLPTAQARVGVNGSLDDFNREVARLLNLPTRQSHRFLVQIDAAVESSSVTFLATVVRISGTGMLIESNRSLALERRYRVHLGPSTQLEIPPLPIRVLREEDSPRSGPKLHHYSAALDGVDQEWMEDVLRQLLA
jgi:hypothetical protein